MVTKSWKWLGTYSNHLMGLAALVAIIAALSTPIWRWVSGPSLIVTLQKNEGTVPPDFIDWSKGLAGELPLMASDMQRRAEQTKARATAHQASDQFFIDSIEEEDTRWAKSLKEYSEADVRKKIQYVRAEDIGRLSLTLRNPSSSEMKHIRIRLSDLHNIWGVFAAGTFLTPEETKSIQDHVVMNPLEAALSEIPSLPPGGTVTVLIFGAIGPYTRADVSVEGASVRSVEILHLEENWFLDLYRNGLFKGFAYTLGAYALLFAIVRGIYAICIRHHADRRA